MSFSFYIFLCPSHRNIFCQLLQNIVVLGSPLKLPVQLTVHSYLKQCNYAGKIAAKFFQGHKKAAIAKSECTIIVTMNGASIHSTMFHTIN